jgi:hypothetical protein
MNSINWEMCKLNRFVYPSNELRRNRIILIIQYIERNDNGIYNKG